MRPTDIATDCITTTLAGAVIGDCRFPRRTDAGLGADDTTHTESADEQWGTASTGLVVPYRRRPLPRRVWPPHPTGSGHKPTMAAQSALRRRKHRFYQTYSGPNVSSNRGFDPTSRPRRERKRSASNTKSLEHDLMVVCSGGSQEYFDLASIGCRAVRHASDIAQWAVPPGR
jgi:hypothetical protein